MASICSKMSPMCTLFLLTSLSMFSTYTCRVSQVALHLYKKCKTLVITITIQSVSFYSELDICWAVSWMVHCITLIVLIRSSVNHWELKSKHRHVFFSSFFLKNIHFWRSTFLQKNYLQKNAFLLVLIFNNQLECFGNWIILSKNYTLLLSCLPVYYADF